MTNQLVSNETFRTSCFHDVSSNVPADGTLLLDHNETQHECRFIECCMCLQVLVVGFAS